MQDGLPRLSREGAGFSCLETKGQAALDGTLGLSADAACGQIGPLWIGMSRADAENILGKWFDTVKVGDQIHYAYALRVAPNGQTLTYAVLSYDAQGRADNIQITGEPWPAAWTFADIKLGDPESAIVSRLGEPHDKVKSDQPNTMLWRFLRWTFSFETVDHRVSSIRVTD